MTILHIASINNSLFNGVCVIVPRHIQAHARCENAGFVNIRNIEINNISPRFDYTENFDIKALPAPFNQPDIVVFHEIYHVEYLKIYPQLLKSRIPYIIVPHGGLTKEAQKKKWLKKKAGNLLLFGRFIKKAAGIQCLSQQELETTHWKNHKFIGTNGMSIPQSLPAEKSFNHGNLRFTYIGRLDAYHKGIDLLLDAVLLNAQHMRSSNSKLDIYGPDYKGRYANVERMIQERGIGDIVTLHNKVSGADKERVLLETDIFVQTSRFEGMPLGILEALSYGLPCLITSGTNLKEFVEDYDAGWCTPTNAESIASGMILAMREQEKYPQKSKNAVRLVAENFSWDTVASAALAEYRKICTSAGT